MQTRFLLALALAATPLAAQIGAYNGPGKPFPYPNGTVTETGRTDLVPFGIDAAGQAAEGRYQMLIPASHLPTAPAEIVALHLLSHGHNGQVMYSNLRISFAHTSLTTLTPDFVANLGANAVQPVNVPNYTTTVTDGQWHFIQIALRGPGSGFNYNGRDNVVLDIQAEIDRTAGPNPGLPTSGLQFQTSSSPTRLDLPFAIGAYGPLGSGVSNATMAQNVALDFMKIGFRVDMTTSSPHQTLQVVGDVSGPSGNVFALNGSLDIEVICNPPGKQFVVMLDVFGLSPFTTYPGLVLGGTWLNPGAWFVVGAGIDRGPPGREDGMGGTSDMISLTIPNDPALNGLLMGTQAMTWSDPNNPGTDLALTNVGTFVINP